ncbi:RNA polymerase sigma factor SigF [Nocardia brasiliensis]|uniref:RNA polymerase sigma factor SigF n=1 Tax=Nocardia brasiliensis TaxID=37326 RepID=UPI001894EEBA|nr:RNA polymerase sigma factor SigF [Nocardia brasiliensis]MBF6130373.1 RNA polymerase sigma factor SigF [Nocardia brasiliensis]
MSNDATRSEVGQQPRRRGGDSYDNIEPQFLELAALDPDDPRRAALREELIGRCLPLAEHIARKFTGRGENFDDLLQIARVGMVAAVDRFDPTQGSPFLAFAVPTIMGEVRRHFRDYTWSVRVPRRLKEIQQTIAPAIETLAQRLGRMPKAREIAEELGADLVEVTQALIARNAYQTSSIDVGSDSDDENAPRSPLDSLGAEEPEYRTVEDYLAVKPLIAALPERERQVLVMRFFESKTQDQIAAHLGVSQMQVSRILAKTLSTLREQALRD